MLLSLNPCPNWTGVEHHPTGHRPTGGIGRMKRALLLAAGLAFAPAAPALAHHNHYLVTSCDSYRAVKRYVPARFNRHGVLVGGFWKTKRKCAHPTRTLLLSTPHHGHINSAYIHYHHAPSPVVRSAPTVVQQPVAQAPVEQCEGKLARMGVGGVLGGIAGRYAVGGKKSDKTILGTTIGAVAGSLVGAATC